MLLFDQVFATIHIIQHNKDYTAVILYWKTSFGAMDLRNIDHSHHARLLANFLHLLYLLYTNVSIGLALKILTCQVASMEMRIC